MKRIVVGIVAIVIAFVVFPMVITADDALIQDTQVDSALAASTNATNTGANVTLTQALHNNLLAEVASITSNQTADGTITAVGWSSGNLSLEISGLAANDPGRIVTVTYDYGALDSYTGMESIALIAPTILFAGMLFGGGLLTWTGARGYSRRRRKTH